MVLDKRNNAKRIISSKYFTNGIAFHPSGEYFIYAETYNQQLWKVLWDDEKREVIREIPFAKTEGPLGPDGLCFGSDHAVYVSLFGQGQIDVFTENGARIKSYQLPYLRPTSCAFEPNPSTNLVISEAESGQVYKLDVGVEGAEVFAR